MQKPAQELKSFAKTHPLKPGQTQTIMFRITPQNLASFSTKNSSWEIEPGFYGVRIGASSCDVRQSKSVKVDHGITVEKVDRVLQPENAIDEMKANEK